MIKVIKVLALNSDVMKKINNEKLKNKKIKILSRSRIRAPCRQAMPCSQAQGKELSGGCLVIELSLEQRRGSVLQWAQNLQMQSEGSRGSSIREKTAAPVTKRNAINRRMIINEWQKEHETDRRQGKERY